jgi:hypothetical protein
MNYTQTVFPLHSFWFSVNISRDQLLESHTMKCILNNKHDAKTFLSVAI